MNRLIAGGIALVVIIYLLASSIYVVNVRQQAIVLRFGQIAAVRTEPGLYFKLPTNLVDTVQLIEDRLLRYDIANMQLQVSDGATYVVDAFLTYRIDDPVKFRERAQGENAPVVPVCAALEAEIVDMSDEEKIEFLAEMNMTEPGLNRVIRAGYRLMGLQTYFTAGEKEVRAWTVEIGASAPQAAGVIHTDFERGFIRAEVIGFNDYVELGGEGGAKKAGKLRVEGKEYIVQDGDVMHFRFSV